MKDFLTVEEKKILKEMHRSLREKRVADRIKAVLYLNRGLTFFEIAELLMLDETTIWRAVRLFQEKGLDGLIETNFHGSSGKLTFELEEEVKEYIRNNLVRSAKEVGEYIKEHFGIEYTQEGLVHLLHRLNFVYKKTKQVPAKAEKEKQKEFLALYQTLKEELGEFDKLYFVDAVHPQHNSMPAYAWIEKGSDFEIKSNTGRKRINLNGALEVSTLKVVIREDPCINADSTLSLLKELEQKNPFAERIVLIVDNARYYKNKTVREYLEQSKIEMVFLPTYSPNLNLIERLWKYFKKEVLRGKYFSTFPLFRQKVLEFFERLDKHKEALKSLLTENFQLLGA